MAVRFALPRIYRVFLRHWKTLTLNILGMAMGLAVSMLLGAYAMSEYSYDSFHVNSSNIYQLWATVQMEPNTTEINRFSAATAETILHDYPDIAAVARTTSTTKATLTSKTGIKLEEKNILYSEKSFFEIFSFPLIEGSLNSFDQPNFIVISEQVRQRYFGGENPVGEVLLYNDTLALQIVGVFKNYPDHSTLSFDFVVSFPTIRNFRDFKNDFAHPQFGMGRFKTYLLIPNTAATNRLPDLLPKINEGFKITSYHLERLAGAHVRNYGNGEKSNVPLFSLIAVVILIVVVFNSMNVTASLSIERTKEIIVRKINGADRWSIMSLFYYEAFWISLISITFSFLIIILILGPVQTTLAIPLDLKMLFVRPFVLWIFPLFVLMTIVGALYPIIILSTTKPVLSLTSSHTSSFASYARKASLLLQIIVSSTLIIGALLMGDQLTYFKTKDLGIDIKNTVVFRLYPEDASNYGWLNRELSKLSGVSEVGASNLALFQEEPPSVIVSRTGSLNSTPLSLIIADRGFLNALKVQSVSGDINSNSNGILLNQTAATALSIKGESNSDQISMGPNPVTVKAVVRDFNFSNLRNKIGNLAVTIADDSASIFRMTGCNVYVKLNDHNDLIGSVKQIEKLYQSRFPLKPFNYSFLSENYFQNFKTERDLLNSLRLFTVIAVLVSAFGLAGFLLFHVTGKMLEISIRKVLGASFIDIIISLLKELFVFVIISLAVGIPLALYLINRWVQSFEFKNSLSPLTAFYGACIVTFTVVIIASLFIIKVVNSNPSKILRKE